MLIAEFEYLLIYYFNSLRRILLTGKAIVSILLPPLLTINLVYIIGLYFKYSIINDLYSSIGLALF